MASSDVGGRVTRDGRALLRSWGDAGARLWRGENRWLLLLIGAYVAARVVVLAGAPVFTAYDSASYAVRGDPTLDRGEILSFTGHAPRLWGVPLFYAVFPDDQWRAAGQWALGTLAWATLAWAVWTLLHHTVARAVAAGAVLGLGLLDFVASLDFAILSESLTVSLGVLTFALLLRWLATGSRWSLGLMAAACVWWTFTRPDTRVFTVIVIVVLAVAAWRLPARRVAAGVGAGVLAVAVAWCTAITPVTTDTFQHWGAAGTTQEEELFLFRLLNDVYSRPDVHDVFTREFGMPPCEGTQRMAGGAWDIVAFTEAYRACPELHAWGEANRDDVFRRLATTAPGAYLAMSYDLTAVSLDLGTYGDVPGVLPQFVHRLAFPGPRWSVPYTLGLLALAIGAAVLAGAYRQRRLAAWSATVTAAACSLSLVAVVVAVGGQFWRFGVQEALGLRIAVIMLAGAALDRFLGRGGAHARRDGVSTATPTTARS